MIKTLRITTIIAALLAVVFFAFPAVYGFRGDEKIEQFLKSPGAIEKFHKAKGAKSRNTGGQTSPLVKQAVAFGMYLNPPRRTAAARKPNAPPVARKQITMPEAPVVFSTKFKLIGTSYYSSRPELSLAYIDEPGKGLHWVRQGSNVAHLTIEEVKDGSIVVKDREKTVTLVAERTPKKSLIKGETTSTSTTTLPGASASITSTVSSFPVVSAGKGVKPALDKATTVSSVVSVKPPQGNAAELDTVLVDFINDLKAKQAAAGANKSTGQSAEEIAALQEAIADLETMRVTTGEAKKLDRLGKELKGVQRNPNPSKNSKMEKSGVPKPPLPPSLQRQPSSRRPPSRRPSKPPSRRPSKPPSSPPR